MEQVLVIQAARIGDLVQTRRLILSLAARQEVHVAVDRGLAELARLLYPGVFIHGLSFHAQPDAARLKEDREVFSLLRSTRFARIYNCNYSPLTESVCRLFDPEQVQGYRPLRHSGGGATKAPWIRLAFRLATRRPIAPLNLVDLWGWLADSPVAPDSVNPPAKKGGRGAALVLAGRVERRSLKLETLTALLELLVRMYPQSPVKLLGGAGQAALAHRLLRALKPGVAEKVRNLCGKTSLVQAAQEMAELDLAATPDTGLMHLAAFAGAPVAAFFLSSAWVHETGPYGLGHLVFQAVTECAPCLESADCKNRVACAGVFQPEKFMTIFARALAGNLPQENVPGLQIWGTGFDEIGLRLNLLSGSDPHAGARQTLRRYVARYLRLNDEDVAQPENAAQGRLAVTVWPEEEWMLPPWRYC